MAAKDADTTPSTTSGTAAPTEQASASKRAGHRRQSGAIRP
jgi:hypothetical protein